MDGGEEDGEGRGKGGLQGTGEVVRGVEGGQYGGRILRVATKLVAESMEMEWFDCPKRSKTFALD